MIFVTVGTHHFEFERLIKEIDNIAGVIDEKVIAQIGSTKYTPKNMIYYKFLEEKKLLEFLKKARVVISHAGAGTLLSALTFKKPLILVPRLKKFNEVIDNHQIELAEELKRKGKAVVIYDIKELEKTLKKIKKNKYEKNKKDKKLVDFLKEYIQEL